MVNAKNANMIIVVYLVSPWETFHRRPMLEALARQALGETFILCINPPISIMRWLSQFGRTFKMRVFSFGRVEYLTKNLCVVTPFVWFPGLGRTWHKRNSFGWKLISRQIRRVLAKIAPHNARIASWVYRPEQISCLGLVDEDFVVYECYDEYTHFYADGKSVPGMREKEEKLMRDADIVFATSHALYESRSKTHPNVHYAPNGVDFERFNRVEGNVLTVADDLKDIPSPRIGYIGNLSGRVDFDLIDKIAERNPGLYVVLIGPADGDAKDEIKKARHRSNVHYLGPRSYESVPRYLKGFDVCMLPYKINYWTDCANPLKFWEYLAAGKPIVSTRASELEQFKEIIWLANDHDMFCAAIRDALKDEDWKKKRRIEIARQCSWDGLTEKMLGVIKKTMAHKVNAISK